MNHHHRDPVGHRAGAALLAAALVTTVAACGGEGADDDAAATSPADTTATTAAAPEPWEDDAQAVLNSAIAPGGPAVNVAGAVAEGAVMGVQLPDGRQFVFTTGVDTDGGPVEAEGTFMIAYLTRTVVEMAAWELIEAGEIDPTEPIARWAPTVPNAEQITLEMLMNWSSGMGDSFLPLQEALRSGPDRAWTLEESIEVIAQVPPLAAPGTAIEGGEAGQGVVVGYVLEEATGRPLDELVAEYVADPLGLASLAFTSVDRLPTELGRVVLEDEGTNIDIDPAESGENAEAWVTGGAPAWGIQTDMADLLTAFGALATGALPGPDQAPRPSAFPSDHHFSDVGLTFGIDSPLVAYCPCTGDAEDRSHSSYGRSAAAAGTSLTYVYFPDTGISMSLRLNASIAEGPDMRRVLYEVRDLIAAAA